MVGPGVNLIGTQDFGQFFHLFTTEAVNNAALARMLHDEADDIFVNILGLRANFVIQIRAVERTLEFRCIYHAQILLDIATNLISCRSSQGYDGSLAYLIDNGTDTPVFGTEVMTPFRDTMCLVNGIEGDLNARQEADIILLCERFRSNV